MKQVHRPRRQRGHALLSFLVTTLVWGVGTAALVRWTLWLMQSDRAALQSRAAAQALQTTLEMGSSGALGQAVEGRTDTRNLLLPDGSYMVLVETRRSDAQSDPFKGSHVTWSAQWEDPWGQKRTLVLHSFWAATRRIY